MRENLALVCFIGSGLKFWELALFQGRWLEAWGFYDLVSRISKDSRDALVFIFRIRSNVTPSYALRTQKKVSYKMEALQFACGCVCCSLLLTSTRPQTSRPTGVSE